MGTPSLGQLSVKLDNFRTFFTNQPPSMVSGMYEKAVRMKSKSNSVSLAPGCCPGSRMVESSTKDRPHLVLRGKGEGIYSCEKSCPNWNALKVCSHVVVTADINGELADFLVRFKPQPTNMSKLALTDMPKGVGKKGGVTAPKKKAPVPITCRKNRTYAQVVNTNPFFIKLLTNRIEVCQGCRGSLKSPQGTIPAPPFNYCVARKEKRPYKDKDENMRISGNHCDTHYHIRINCLPEGFDKTFLQFPEDLPENYKSFFIRNL